HAKNTSRRDHRVAQCAVSGIQHEVPYRADFMAVRVLDSHAHQRTRLEGLRKIFFCLRNCWERPKRDRRQTEGQHQSHCRWTFRHAHKLMVSTPERHWGFCLRAGLNISKRAVFVQKALKIMGIQRLAANEINWRYSVRMVRTATTSACTCNSIGAR